MQRTKQQALMFLLGATLVGGVLGFSAERIIGHKGESRGGGRESMYNDLALTVEQRAAMDSLLDVMQCRRQEFLAPVKPQLDSLRAAGRTEMLALLTPAQREKMETRFREAEEKRTAETRERAARRNAEPCDQ
jgi:Spy/CpxP family protein refolding chaperone